MGVSAELVKHHPKLRSFAQPRLNDYIPHDPEPPQAAFLLLPNLEAFYGGGAGGGKSDALLMAALQYVDLPGYAAVIVRKTFAMLAKEGALLDRARQWLGPTKARWNGDLKRWTFPSGSSLSFGHLEDPAAISNYQSAEYQFIGIDEVTDISEGEYRFLFSRLRRLEGSSIPVRMRSASNPVGPGKEWAHRRFIVEGPTAINDLTGQSEPRVFIPALLEDNPHLDRDQYVRSLANLDPVMRAQLLHGDWEVAPEGGRFKREWFAGRFVDRDKLPGRLRVVRYWDLAATEPKPGEDPDWTAGCLLGRSKDNLWFVLDVRRTRAADLAVEKFIETAAEEDRSWWGRIPVRIEQEPGAAGKLLMGHYRRKLAAFDVSGIRSTGDKMLRAGPVAARAEAGEVYIVRGDWNTVLLDELAAFGTPNVHDDQVDALSGAYSVLAEKNLSIAIPETEDQTSYWKMDVE